MGLCFRSCLDFILVILKRAEGGTLYPDFGGREQEVHMTRDSMSAGCMENSFYGRQALEKIISLSLLLFVPVFMMAKQII